MREVETRGLPSWTARLLPALALAAVVGCDGRVPAEIAPPAMPSPQPAQPSPTVGKVVGVSTQFDLVMLDLGEKHGIAAGTFVRVERDGQPIARLLVDRVFPDMSATIMAKDYGRGPVRKGDRVVAEGR